MTQPLGLHRLRSTGLLAALACLIGLMGLTTACQPHSSASAQPPVPSGAAASLRPDALMNAAFGAQHQVVGKQALHWHATMPMPDMPMPEGRMEENREGNMEGEMAATATSTAPAADVGMNVNEDVDTALATDFAPDTPHNTAWPHWPNAQSVVPQAATAASAATTLPAPSPPAAQPTPPPARVRAVQVTPREVIRLGENTAVLVIETTPLATENNGGMTASSMQTVRPVWIGAIYFQRKPQAPHQAATATADMAASPLAAQTAPHATVPSSPPSAPTAPASHPDAAPPLWHVQHFTPWIDGAPWPLPATSQQTYKLAAHTYLLALQHPICTPATPTHTCTTWLSGYVIQPEGMQLSLRQPLTGNGRALSACAPASVPAASAPMPATACADIHGELAAISRKGQAADISIHYQGKLRTPNGSLQRIRQAQTFRLHGAALVQIDGTASPVPW